MKYTVKELIDVLENFPEDLEIKTDLAFMWNYPDELKPYKNKMTEDDFKFFTMDNATSLCIFEGDWESGVISDNMEILNTIKEEY